MKNILKVSPARTGKQEVMFIKQSKELPSSVKLLFLLLCLFMHLEYEWTEKLHGKLKEVFHIDKFRPKQLSAINASLKGHDVILIMPTGGGKSLVYQLPSLISDGK